MNRLVALFIGVFAICNSALQAQSALDLIDSEVAQQVLENIEEANNRDPVNMLGKLADRPWAKLRFLDRLNGKVSELELQNGSSIEQQYLNIELKACYVPAAAPASDAVGYLVIHDKREEIPSFQGWMIASSPALSALDHPRYDVWVVSCSKEATGAEYVSDPNAAISVPPNRPEEPS